MMSRRQKSRENNKKASPTKCIYIYFIYFNR